MHPAEAGGAKAGPLLGRLFLFETIEMNIHRTLALMALLCLTACAGWKPRVVAAMQYTVRATALGYKAYQVDVVAKRIAAKVAARPDASVAMLDAELAKGRERRAVVGAALVGLAALLEAWGDAYQAGAEPSLPDVVAAYCGTARDYPEAELPAPPARVACPGAAAMQAEAR